MATSAASSVLPKTLSLASSLLKPSQASSVSLPSKPFLLLKPLAVLASSCSVSPLLRRARPSELGFVTRVVLSDLELEQGEEFEEGEGEFSDDASFDEEESNGEEEVRRAPSQDPKLFVGNLPYDVDSAQLAGIFGDIGEVDRVEVIYDKITGRSRGFGFVTMASPQDAAAAEKQLDGYTIEGREMRVRSGPPPPRDDSSSPSRGFRSGGSGSQDEEGNRLYVGNLSWGVDDSALQSLFSEQGNVTSARVIYDRETGRSRGFGFVTFGNVEDAENAVNALNGVDLDGRMIRVTVAEARPPRRQF